MSEVRVEELVKLSLAHTDRKLKLIPEPTMEEALEQFVDKQQPQAIGDAVNDYLDQVQDRLRRDKACDGAAIIEEQTAREADQVREAASKAAGCTSRGWIQTSFRTRVQSW